MHTLNLPYAPVVEVEFMQYINTWFNKYNPKKNKNINNRKNK